MSSEVAHVSISHRSSHSTMGVEEEELPSSDRELVGVLSGDVEVRLPDETSYSILK